MKTNAPSFCAPKVGRLLRVRFHSSGDRGLLIPVLRSMQGLSGYGPTSPWGHQTPRGGAKLLQLLQLLFLLLLLLLR